MEKKRKVEDFLREIDLNELSAEELKVMAARFSALGTSKGKASDPYAAKRFQGTSRDSLVQRVAAVKFYEMHKLQGMSFRDIAEAFGVSYERVRQLYYKFHPKEEEKDGERSQQEKSA